MADRKAAQRLKKHFDTLPVKTFINLITYCRSLFNPFLKNMKDTLSINIHIE